MHDSSSSFAKFVDHLHAKIAQWKRRENQAIWKHIKANNLVWRIFVHAKLWSHSNSFCALYRFINKLSLSLSLNPVDEGLPMYALLAIIMSFIDRTHIGDYHIYGTYGQ